MGLIKHHGTWYFQSFENGKRKRRSLATSDKREAELRASKFRRALRARRGGFESFEETEVIPLSDLVREYASELKRRGRSDEHVDKTLRRLLLICDGERTIAHLTADRIRLRLGRIAETGAERMGFRGKIPPKPLCAKTTNDYRVCVFAFFAWLVEEGRWPENPVARVKRTQVTNTTRERRALLPEELEVLLSTVPVERATLYRLAATTGLRRKELRSLRWSSIDLETATVRIRAGSAKNRKDATLPLPEGTVAALRLLRGDAQATAPVFATIPLIRTFYLDLKRAGLQKSARFEGVDFHSLRATFATSLARAGVPLSQAQRLMRHSTPVLTSNVYTKFELVDAHAAVGRIDPAELAPPLGGRKGRDRVKSGSTYDDKDGDLGGTSRDGSTHKQALTCAFPQEGSPTAEQSNSPESEQLSKLHPAGFEPARWGSKPHILSIR